MNYSKRLVDRAPSPPFFARSLGLCHDDSARPWIQSLHRGNVTSVDAVFSTRTCLCLA